MRRLTKILFFLATTAQVCRAADFSTVRTTHVLTSVMQFKTLTGADFLGGCDFHLTGTITLVDTNRDLVVLQDATGAVALNFPPIDNLELQTGQTVTLDGTNACPLFASFPDFPHRPSGQEIRTSFEAPENWGEYNLTRIRGFLHPKVSGEYRFYIASDDSSELWLSTDANPSNVRKIASVPRYSWTDPHQWSKIPSQRSEALPLKAGEAYYLEALQEQTIAGEHLSVAWQEPAPGQSEITVIDGSFLSPWSEARNLLAANRSGILREYWTNYFGGNIEGIGGARPYVSTLTVKELQVSQRTQGEMPKPISIDWSQPLTAENNWRWVSAKGLVRFKALGNDSAVFEIFDGQSAIEVRALCWSREQSEAIKQITNAVLQVEGVCEGCDNQQGAILPARIWALSAVGISFFEAGPTNEFGALENPGTPTTSPSNAAVPGYFGTRGVVTFNDRVFGSDYIFVQEGDSVLMIAAASSAMKSQLNVGHYVDLGGSLQSGKHLQILTPLVVTELGLHFMPSAVIYSSDKMTQANQDGRWTEVEGVVHLVNTNSTLSVQTKFGTVYLWLGQTPSNFLPQFVDTKIRVRGVLMLGLLDKPTLLIPSQSFLDVLEAAPENPFALPASSIASVISANTEMPLNHRVRVSGEITWQNENSFFVQDNSGGIRVQNPTHTTVKPGEPADVVAFVESVGASKFLTEPLMQPAKLAAHISPKKLDLSDAPLPGQSGSLVQADATLLAQKTNGNEQVLELQEQQRVFVAMLSNGKSPLPPILPGSRVRIVGVCDDKTSVAGEKSTRAQFLSSLAILLRSPQDVTLLSGPPWWTWKRTATLVGALLTILSVTLLWIYLLQLRLKRQQAAQLAFSQHVLGKLEEERRRIAVNLHDSLGQTLLVIKNHAALATQLPEETRAVKNRLDEISGTASHAIEEVRRITHGLRPYQLDRLGLTQTIRTLVNQAAENREISFASRIEDIDRLFDKDGEIHVYRIVQEAVTNVAKHAAATEATVVIKKRESSVSLSVRDNGKGFDPAKLATRPHELGFGLTGIGERVRILKGTLTIDSRPHGGTNVTVEVPVKESGTFTNEK